MVRLPVILLCLYVCAGDTAGTCPNQGVCDDESALVQKELSINQALSNPGKKDVAQQALADAMFLNKLVKTAMNKVQEKADKVAYYWEDRLKCQKRFNKSGMGIFVKARTSQSAAHVETVTKLWEEGLDKAKKVQTDTFKASEDMTDEVTWKGQEMAKGALGKSKEHHNKKDIKKMSSETTMFMLKKLEDIRKQVEDLAKGSDWSHKLDKWEEWYQMHYKRSIDEMYEMASEGSHEDKNPEGIDGNGDHIVTNAEGRKIFVQRYGRGIDVTDMHDNTTQLGRMSNKKNEFSPEQKALRDEDVTNLKEMQEMAAPERFREYKDAVEDLYDEVMIAGKAMEAGSKAKDKSFAKKVDMM